VGTVLVIKHHTMRTYGEMDIKLRAFLTSVLDASVIQSRSGCGCFVKCIKYRVDSLLLNRLSAIYR